MASKDANYVIWSFRNRAWWGPDGAGYTPHLFKAGEYSRGEAADIMFGGLPGGALAVEVGLAEDFDGHSAKAIEGVLEQWRRL